MSPLAPNPRRSLRVLASLILLTSIGGWLPAAHAATRWDPVMLAEQGMFYMDPNSVRDMGERKEVWTALDYRKPQFTSGGKSYLSTRAQVWINCRLKMGRVMHLTYYSGAMLAGKEIEKQGMLQDWTDIVPDTPVYKLARKLC